MAGYIGSKSSVTLVDGITKNGGTLTGDLSFGDNDKAKFGAGDDLQIYHDGSNSIIHDNGTGNLQIRAGNLNILNAAATENYLSADNGGAVNLFYDNSKKIETTSTGIDVTGTAVMDGLTVDGTPVRFNSTAPMLNFMETGVADSNHRIRQNAGNFYIQKLSDDEGTATDRLVIDGGTGNVGIGTSSPSRQLHVNNASESNIRLQGGSDYAELRVKDADNAFSFHFGGSESMRIHASGGISFGTGNDFGSVTSFCTQSGKPASVYRDIEGNGNYIIFQNSSNTTIGSITRSSSSTVYATSSDYRLKENVDYTWDATTRLKQLKPARFNWIADDTNTLVDGFLAHEVATVVPEAIIGTHNEVEVWKDGDELPDGVTVGDNKLDDDGNTIPVYQGIDQSKLVPLLTAALQEALTEIASLKTRVEALEA